MTTKTLNSLPNFQALSNLESSQIDKIKNKDLLKNCSIDIINNGFKHTDLPLGIQDWLAGRLVQVLPKNLIKNMLIFLINYIHDNEFKYDFTMNEESQIKFASFWFQSIKQHKNSSNPEIQQYPTQNLSSSCHQIQPAINPSTSQHQNTSNNQNSNCNHNSHHHNNNCSHSYDYTNFLNGHHNSYVNSNNNNIQNIITHNNNDNKSLNISVKKQTINNVNNTVNINSVNSQKVDLSDLNDMFEAKQRKQNDSSHPLTDHLNLSNPASCTITTTSNNQHSLQNLHIINSITNNTTANNLLHTTDLHKLLQKASASNNTSDHHSILNNLNIINDIEQHNNNFKNNNNNNNQSSTNPSNSKNTSNSESPINLPSSTFNIITNITNTDNIHELLNRTQTQVNNSNDNNNNSMHHQNQPHEINQIFIKQEEDEGNASHSVIVKRENIAANNENLMQESMHESLNHPQTSSLILNSILSRHNDNNDNGKVVIIGLKFVILT